MNKRWMSMPASQFTIYLINSESNFNDAIDIIVSDFNKNQSEGDKIFTEKETSHLPTHFIEEYRIFVRAAKTKPDWGTVLQDIVSDLGDIQNTNHSFVLFLKIKDYIFAASGGAGHMLIASAKKYNFGLDLLSRIMDKDDTFIKRVRDRYFSGNKIGGGTQFLGNVTISSENNLNNMFRELDLELPSDVIEEKLGVDIPTKKKTYQFLATDSIKLSKSISLRELDSFLFSVTKLMNQTAPYSLIPFYQIHSRDPIVSVLDNLCINKFKSYIKQSSEDPSIQIIPYYHIYDEHAIIFGNDSTQYEIYNNSSEMIEHFQNHVVSEDLSTEDMLKQIKIIKTISKLENDVVTESSLYHHLDCKVTYQEKNYWLTEGVWFFVDNNFMETIDLTFVEKVPQLFDLDFSLDKINTWETGDEGEYNFSHNNINKVYVLDKILVNEIEICDLLIEDQNYLYFVHVKDGLKGDVKTLSAQIEASMTIMQSGLSNPKILKDFYTSISSKIHDSSKEKAESTISKSARKFIEHFPDTQSFVDFIHKYRSNIVYIFAYRPLPSHDFYNPHTIKSTAAKLSMINLTNVINNFDFNLKFLEIDKFETQST